ncbi:MAG TPA: D-2-hydroxyacid dehydrogenase [Longimicrobiales bacterium]|nr:D-2-hydroxyacid dehydrogenase [Longimicrobiales bacterium]
MPRAVLDLNDRRPIWTMPDWMPQRVREALPEGWDLHVVTEMSDGSGDGAGRVAPAVLAAVADAEIYMGYGIAAELLRAAPRLAWVHSGAAGVGSSLTPEMLASPVLFTNSAGIHAEPMAETVLGMVLFFGRGFDLAMANKARGVWSTDPYYVAGAPLRELPDTTVGLVGFGGIGREIARRVAGLGARVIAVKRRPPEDGEADLAPVRGGGGLGDAIELVHGPGGLERVLVESDVVVLCAPETSETRGLLDASRLARLKDGALLVNVGRGKLVDEAALVAELASGRLRGAGLDVFAKEPLAPGHPLWAMPNVLITPHVSAVTRGFWRREADLITENIRRYLAGERLVNLVDKVAGY